MNQIEGDKKYAVDQMVDNTHNSTLQQSWVEKALHFFK